MVLGLRRRNEHCHPKKSAGKTRCSAWRCPHLRMLLCSFVLALESIVMPIEVEQAAGTVRVRPCRFMNLALMGHAVRWRPQFVGVPFDTATKNQ
jgi:hypothetical protein